MSRAATRAELGALVARMAHDVGKHGTRVARNLPPGPIPEVLARMLLADLYGRGDERRLSERLEGLLAQGAELRRDPRVLEAARALASIDALEARARALDEAALRAAAAAALEADRALRALLGASREPPEGEPG